MPQRVLIVDDALFMRNMLREIFSSAGWEIAGEATDGTEVVQKYQQLRPNLVTMDIVMPERNGIEALQELLVVDPEAVVIMCSALGQESMVLEAIQSGARDFIVKPFQPGQVLEAVKRIFG